MCCVAVVMSLMSVHVNAADKMYNFVCHKQVVLTGSAHGGFSKKEEQYVDSYFSANNTKKTFSVMNIETKQPLLVIPYEVLVDSVFMVIGGVSGKWQIDIMTNSSKRVDDFQLIKYTHDVDKSIIRQKTYAAYEYSYVLKECEVLPNDFFN